MTLVEAAKLAPGVMNATFIEEFPRSSAILQAIRFKNITGAGEFYNREYDLPGVGFRGVNEGYQESVGVINPESEALKIFGGDLDVDRAIIDMQGPTVRSTHELMKVKALALAWTSSFIKGSSQIDPRQFDGLQVRLTGSQLIQNGSGAGSALSLRQLDAAIDQTYMPTHLIMGKAMRRILTSAERNLLGGYLVSDIDAFGNQISRYNGLPILVTEWDNYGNLIQNFTETSPDGTATNNDSIYVVSFMDDMVQGIQGAVDGVWGISTRDLGELQVQPVFRTRLDWYCAIAVYHGRAATRLWGITNTNAIA